METAKTLQRSGACALPGSEKIVSLSVGGSAWQPCFALRGQSAAFHPEGLQPEGRLSQWRAVAGSNLKVNWQGFILPAEIFKMGIRAASKRIYSLFCHCVTRASAARFRKALLFSGVPCNNAAASGASAWRSSFRFGVDVPIIQCPGFSSKSALSVSRHG